MARTTSAEAPAPREGLEAALEALRRRPSLVRILAVIEAGGGALWTREVIRRVGSWTHTHRRLLELAALGLISRRVGIANGRQAVWNGLTPLGREILALLRDEGHPALEGPVSESGGTRGSRPRETPSDGREVEGVGEVGSEV